jgi:ATP-dependent DNA helicase RecQ
MASSSTDATADDDVRARHLRLIHACLSIDLEVGVDDGCIHRLAAVAGDGIRSLSLIGGAAQALQRLDRLAGGFRYLVGHNLEAFDRPHLIAADPALGLLQLPTIDTLRLNPLAFPRHPYHHLVKHYKDGALRRGQRNDPALDSRLALDLLADQLQAFTRASEQLPELFTAWHGMLGHESGTDAVFSTASGRARPAAQHTAEALRHCLAERGCASAAAQLAADPGQWGWPLAYALAWLSVAGGNSVMPPWVRHAFPAAPRLVRRLRDTPCTDPACSWCRSQHDPRLALRRWFGLDGFRPQPAGADGRPLQQAIVEAALRDDAVLGILPTGTGKSLCYQLPALLRYDRLGALTVVVSPLVALMADQLRTLEARGIGCAAALNGLLSVPERADVLDRVRLGDVGILIVSPEQLRSRSLRSALEQREIGAWVLDEAHCLSKWGHDFRPDYRYIGRYIRELAGTDALPPLLCLTATAKPDVVADIVNYFAATLARQLSVFDGGASRDNLEFAVLPCTAAQRFELVHRLLDDALGPGKPGGAIVYCASRSRTEELAEFLREKGLAAEHFHAGIAPERKKAVQQRFVDGTLAVIVATNAFGMGIDKPDVRVVVHADVPGSLENYLQEAGRAGRDRAAARCVLLYVEGDVERQFSLSARSRLTQREIQAVLRAIERLDRRKRGGSGEVIATAGEILLEDIDHGFERDSATEDTRVRTAIAWLEEAGLLRREENRVQVFASSLRVPDLAAARERLSRSRLAPGYQAQLLAIVQTLIGADADEGVSTDELMLAARLDARGVREALFDLEALGIASNDTALTAFVHVGVERSSQRRLEEAAALEQAVIDLLREAAPDMAAGEASVLHLRHLSQRLHGDGHPQARPELLSRLLRSLAADGRRDDDPAGEGGAAMSLRTLDAETTQLTLRRPWSEIQRMAQLRRAGAQRLLEHWLGTLAEGARGSDLLASTTLGKLLAAINDDLALRAQLRDPRRLLDRALLWLHEQEVLRLGKGLTVFRPAMTIRLAAERRRRFTQADFEPLKQHYAQLVFQVHVMAAYAERALASVSDAMRLVIDYFALPGARFVRRWLRGLGRALELQITPASWQAIVDSLGDPAQQRIVADEREDTNVLVLAGPGSGKTRVLVHRIAYLVRVRREKARGILALAYNRHAAAQIRHRLDALIGDDARGVTVVTCHALAMRLAGVRLEHRGSDADSALFEVALERAVELLEGRGLEPDEADVQRERLLAGFRWILVDEYQDIGPGQYRLIAALAGRSLADAERRLSLFAVGDDDQNIYAFAGASVEYIRRFDADYRALSAYLTQNYRSSGHIVAATQALIAPARARLKANHPITVDRARAQAPPGGRWQSLDPVARGRVQWLRAPAAAADPADAADAPIAQAIAAVGELQRLAAIDPQWSWRQAAVIAREWRTLEPVRACCELRGIPAQWAGDELPHFWRLRETQQLLAQLRAAGRNLVSAPTIAPLLEGRPANPWRAMLGEAVEQYALETGGAELPLDHFVEYLVDWGREARRRQTGLLLTTAHRAKGLEFDHVLILDGRWRQRGDNEDPDSPRRLLYVAATRARQTLALVSADPAGFAWAGLEDHAVVIERPVAVADGPLRDPAMRRRHMRAELRQVDLGWAGRRREGDACHRHIAQLETGDALRLEQSGSDWLLHEAGSGMPVGRMAHAFAPPAGEAVTACSVAAVLRWSRSLTAAQYAASVQCDEWEVVLPEFVLEPRH